MDAPKPKPKRKPKTKAPVLEGRLSFQVYQVTSKLAQVAGPVFRDFGLDIVSARLLIFLLERGEMRVGDLVDVLIQPQSTISHQLQRLDKRKLIRRRRMKQDNRAVTVVLTPEGEEAARQCDLLSRDVYQQMTKDFTVDEVAQLGALLTRLLATIEHYGQLHGTPPDKLPPASLSASLTAR